MQSAFGIDHGEISKIAVRRPPGSKKAATMLARAVGKAPPKPPPTVVRRSPPVHRQVGAKLNQIGEADISLKGIGGGIGSGARKVGGFLERHPGLTGTAAVGGGGAAGYKILSNREPKRKKKS